MRPLDACDRSDHRADGGEANPRVHGPSAQGAAARVFVGLDFGVFNSVRRDLSGLQLGVVSVAVEKVAGTQLGFGNFSFGSTYGVQLGVFNYSKSLKGVQIGLLNGNGSALPFLRVLPGINIGW